jgi:hypothetical protein
VSFGSRRPSQFARYEPREHHGAAVMTSHERVKFRILELQYDAEDAIEEMLKYKLCNKTMPLAIEVCNVKIFKIFLTVRPHINTHFRREHGDIAKIKREKIRKDRQELFVKNKVVFDYLDSVFENFLKGGRIKEEKIFEVFNFLTQFIYDVGITRIEVQDRDPIKEFTVGAYGEDLSPPDVDDGTDKRDS